MRSSEAKKVLSNWDHDVLCIRMADDAALRTVRNQLVMIGSIISEPVTAGVQSSLSSGSTSVFSEEYMKEWLE